MSVSNIDELACNFITAYLESIRYKASRIPKADHGLFPFYWYHSSKITIFKTLGDDLAISIDRVVSGKVDKTTIRDSDVRIEETQFPNLDYITFPFLGFQGIDMTS